MKGNSEGKNTLAHSFVWWNFYLYLLFLTAVRKNFLLLLMVWYPMVNKIMSFVTSTRHHWRSVIKPRLSFSVCHATETLPPSGDAAELHIKWTNYQGFIWRLAAGKLPPVLTTLTLIPRGCRELTQWSCTGGCSTNSCFLLEVKVPVMHGCLQAQCCRKTLS